MGPGVVPRPAAAAATPTAPLGPPPRPEGRPRAALPRVEARRLGEVRRRATAAGRPGAAGVPGEVRQAVVAPPPLPRAAAVQAPRLLLRGRGPRARAWEAGGPPSPGRQLWVKLPERRLAETGPSRREPGPRRRSPRRSPGPRRLSRCPVGPPRPEARASRRAPRQAAGWRRSGTRSGPVALWEASAPGWRIPGKTPP